MRTGLLFLFIIIFSGLNAQRSKVIAVFQLIESEKYEEAKTAIEEAARDEKTMKWPRTWYTKGYLCQVAYEKGIKENDKKKYELYPDQLFVAYTAYNRALIYDRTGRYNDQIAPHYIRLANDFMKVGEKHYKSEEYEEAFRAYEHALKINQSEILNVETDSSLIYNTALAAYKAKEWQKAVKYLDQLNENNYSANVPHLLYTINIETGDTLSAERSLITGIRKYEGDDNLVLILVDLLLNSGKPERALHVLDSVSVSAPDKYIFPYAKGLAYQKTNQYDEAVESYKTALKLAPEQAKIYANIGTCYYNQGVEIQEHSLSITNNSQYVAEKERAKEAYESAVSWLEKAREKNVNDHDVVELLNQLYRILNLQPGTS